MNITTKYAKALIDKYNLKEQAYYTDKAGKTWIRNFNKLSLYLTACTIVDCLRSEIHVLNAKR